MTPRGRGAVATIRIVGDLSQLDPYFSRYFRAANGRTLAEQTLGKIVFGTWGADHPEDVVLSRCDDQTLEVHCHGGDWAANRILEDCQHMGGECCSWQQLLLSTEQRLAVEIRECLSKTVTWRTTEYLLSQAEGRLEVAFRKLADITWNDDDRNRAAQQIRELLRWANFGLHLTEPWRVVLTGRPNVGKSSLINALLGYQRSIVFDQPGTTRDVVTAETAFEGWPMILSDTAGLRDAHETLEAEGIALARQTLKNADLVIQLVDFRETPEEELLPGALPVAHKCDLPGYDQLPIPTEILRVSSVTGTGLAELQREIVKRLIPAAPSLETLLPLTTRHIAWLEELQAALRDGSECTYRNAVARFLSSTEIPVN